MKPTPISAPRVAPARHAAREAPKTCRGKSAAKTSAARGIRTARYVSGGQWSSTPRATEKVEPQMSVVNSIAPSAARFDLSFMNCGGWRPGSNPEEDYEDAGLGGALEGAGAVGEGELVCDEGVGLDGAAAQQFERGLEAPAARADDADLVHDDGRGAQLRRAVEGGLEDERAARLQQPERGLEAGGRPRRLDRHVEGAVEGGGQLVRPGRADAAFAHDAELALVAADEGDARARRRLQRLRAEQPELAVADDGDARLRLDARALRDAARGGERLGEDGALVRNLVGDGQEVD